MPNTFAPHQLRQLMAVPYVLHGRDLQGWDCWGLVRHVYSLLRPVWLPPHAAVAPTEPERMTLAVQHTMRVGDFRPGRHPQEADIACAYSTTARLVLRHVGIVVQADGLERVLHITHDRGCRLTRWAAWQAGYPAVQVYRRG